MTARLPVPALFLLLAACGSESQPPAAAQAGGQVLEGSISDAMLPLDTVRSQAPLAPRPAAEPGEKPADGDDPAATDEASPAPAEAPEDEVRPDAE